MPIVFHRFFTWTAQGDADSHLSLILVIRANAVDKEINDPRGYITNVINPYT
jgi:hypothetical protein